MVATKDSESPMRAHLRGAIALINEKDSNPMEQTPSQQVFHTIEAQIVCNIPARYLVTLPLTYPSPDQELSILHQPYDPNTHCVAFTTCAGSITQSSTVINRCRDSTTTTNLGTHANRTPRRNENQIYTPQIHRNRHQPRVMDTLASRAMGTYCSDHNPGSRTQRRHVP